MTTVLIGMDDTDNATSPGTGHLARRVAQEIARLGGTPVGTTRHQFLIDPRIPYTGHNRGICMAVTWKGPLAGLDFVFDLVRDGSAEGSDPGVCLALPEAVPPAVIHWGERALRDLLAMDEAIALAQRYGLALRPLGGTGQGIIGALGSVGLRAGGNDGRFVDMPGLRELGDSVAGETLAAMGIHLEYHTPTPHNHPSTCKTLGWIRPRLSHGQAILPVEWSDDDDAWIPVDRKKVHAAMDES